MVEDYFDDQVLLNIGPHSLMHSKKELALTKQKSNHENSLVYYLN